MKTLHPPITTAQRNADLATIHQTARNLGLSEFARRSLQYEVTGRESCLEMNATERRQVIDALEAEAASRRPPTPEVVTDEMALEILGW